ncbi:Inositol-pentakisphosphate 2-kinase [Toensbergia leucococca]|nr:Inositol-pentakisphosphate 2-kinase [Toensbergia leucococca]
MITIDLDPSMTLEYLAEGGANVVYRFSLPPPSPSTSSDLNFDGSWDGSGTPPPSEIPPLRSDPRLEGKLLRIRKNLPWADPVITSQQRFETIIQPLFPAHNLVEQILVRPPRILIQECNNNLKNMERNGARCHKRHGVYLAEDEIYASLVIDMTTDPSTSLVAVEFKPKWLAQSPSAPSGSRRCRTCALRAMKRHKRKISHEAIENLGYDFCPLDLVSRDRIRVARVVDCLMGLPGNSATTSVMLREHIIDFLLDSSVLNRLQRLQVDLDPIGVLKTEVKERGFLTAMTLRDCTMYLKVMPS